MSETDFEDPELLAELEEIVHEMLDGLVEASIPSGAVPAVVGHDGVTIESRLPIVGGGAQATLTLRVPAATAIGLASALYGEAPEQLDTDDAAGTIGELSNVLGGSVKTLIEEETALDVPHAHVVRTDALTPLRCISVTHSLGTFDVHLGNDMHVGN